MDKPSFPKLTPISFLQAFVTQSLAVKEGSQNDGRPDLGASIEKLGLEASACFEKAYRCATDTQADLDQDSYATMVIGIKNQIGGNFSRASSPPGIIRVVNTRCPFGESVQHAPELCRMTSSVFGGIAARHFGYAKVVLHKRIAMGDGVCDISICTDPHDLGKESGDEYRQIQDRIVGQSASAPLLAHIDEQMKKTWCNALPTTSGDSARHAPIVAQSPEMVRALEAVMIAAPTRATVLISGETGVGKEVIARAIHAMSPRWAKPFIAVNCGAIPEGLIESHLFGHERGAFTNAIEVHHGVFERAWGGTLFLDEIDSLAISAQVRLLRVLESGEFERVGGHLSLHADARIVAAGSNRIEALVKKGLFRSDLYYRINIVPICLPPLRERRSDIPPLVEQILSELAVRHQHTPKTLSREALFQAMMYDWPGNIRELRNVLERAFLFSPGVVIEDLQVPSLPQNPASQPQLLQTTLKVAKKQAADSVEVKILHEALVLSHGNVRVAAKSLGMTPRALHQKLRSHHMNSNDFRDIRKTDAAPLD